MGKFRLNEVEQALELGVLKEAAERIAFSIQFSGPEMKRATHEPLRPRDTMCMWI